MAVRGLGGRGGGHARGAKTERLVRGRAGGRGRRSLICALCTLSMIAVVGERRGGACHEGVASVLTAHQSRTRVSCRCARDAGSVAACEAPR